MGEAGDDTRFDALIDANAEQAFGFLEELVRADSTADREHDALEVLARRFTASGFDIDRIAIPTDIGSDPAAGVPQLSYEGRYDVIARRVGGAGGPSLLLNGHIDVVPPGDLTQWSAPPFQPVRRDGWLYGRGGGDMKAGFAMGWLALDAVQRVDPQAITGDLSVLAVIEEECTGNGTLAACRAGHLADAVVLLEPTGLDLLVAGIGVLWFELVVQGSAGHAQAAERAASAFDGVVELVEGLRELERRLNADVDDEVFVDVDHPYNFNVGELNLGDWQSSVPSRARLGVRFGFPRSWTVDEAIAVFGATVDEVTAASAALRARPPRLRPNGFRAEGYALDAGHHLVQSLARAHRRAHGEPPVSYALGSTTDARFYLNQFSVPAVCYGPRAVDIHGIDEHVELQSIVDGAKTLARFIVDYYRTPAR
jgi:acetylornithine deacetylase